MKKTLDLPSQKQTHKDLKSIISPTVWVHFSVYVKTKGTTKLLHRKLGVKTTWEYYFSLLPKLAMYKSST